jgi:hypothetical protein
MLEHAIADDRPSRDKPYTVVSRRFEFVEIAREGSAVTAGYAPYLDYRPLTDGERAAVVPLLDDPWFDTDLEAVGQQIAIEEAVPAHLAKVRLHTESRLDTTEQQVKDRLRREIDHWDFRAADLRERMEAGQTPKMNVDQAQRRAEGLSLRLENRLGEIARQRSLRALPPLVVGGALVIPAGFFRAGGDTSHPDEFAISRAEVERRAVEAVLATEDRRGWNATDMNTVQPNHPGYDVRSTRPGSDGEPGEIRFIEVKGRIAGADTVTVSCNEILTALNEPDQFILALVRVSPDGNDEVRYVERPFEDQTESALGIVASINFSWSQLWERGEKP